MVTALLAATSLDVNAANASGRTALMRAAYVGRTEMVAALLAAPGLNVNAADRYGWTALMLAADGGHAAVVTALLAAPGLDVNAADGDGRTARALARARGHVRIASLLRADRRYSRLYAPTSTLTTKLGDTLKGTALSICRGGCAAVCVHKLCE